MVSCIYLRIWSLTRPSSVCSFKLTIFHFVVTLWDGTIRCGLHRTLGSDVTVTNDQVACEWEGMSVMHGKRSLMSVCLSVCQSNSHVPIHVSVMDISRVQSTHENFHIRHNYFIWLIALMMIDSSRSGRITDGAKWNGESFRISVCSVHCWLC